MTYIEILGAIGIPILRSVGGWLTYALKDNEISKFEWTKLGETILRTGIYSTIIYFGFEGFGFDANLIATTASAVILDKITKSLKENKTVLK